MDFIEFLNKKTNNSYTNVKVTEVTYDEEQKNCICKFVYDGNVKDLSEDDKPLFSQMVKEYLGIDVGVTIKFKKETLDIDVIFQHISTFIQIKYPSSYSAFQKEYLEIVDEDNNKLLKISIFDVYYNYFSSRNFEKELVDYLKKYFFAVFNVQLVKIENVINIENDLKAQEERIQNIVNETIIDERPNVFFVENVQKLIGEELNTECRYVADLRKPQKDINTAGLIKNIYQRTFKSKKQKNEDGTPLEKAYYSFSLELNGAKIDCVYFPKNEDLARFQTILEGTEIICFGDVEEFNSRINFKVKQISLCKLPKLEEVKIEYKKVNDSYKFVQPEPYIIKEQSDLFSFNMPVEVNKILKDNVFVVYDFETTGLNFLENEIIEIGAVKVVSGVVKETFSVLIKPQKMISFEITNITGITNEMVKDCYSISDVIQDFYKFCFGSVMVGYNSIDFDNKFLQVAGRNNRYNFDNKQMDAMLLAKQYLRSVKNYRLKTIASYLNITLDNAHRAVFDALATAEVFIKLTNFLEKE